MLTRMITYGFNAKLSIFSVLRIHCVTYVIQIFLLQFIWIVTEIYLQFS
jgi:hypothetical protein